MTRRSGSDESTRSGRGKGVNPFLVFVLRFVISEWNYSELRLAKSHDKKPCALQFRFTLLVLDIVKCHLSKCIFELS